ncbi:MAG: hypothetical protein CVV51_08930 [Spirochaetae bacterium HGW-Spirochaetae-7]|nr:MAG: hypothetical protein CVV51_08930 [Spirochaetae bacterium HGW-Spirochaetae-7]
MTPSKGMLDSIAADEAELVLDRFDEDDAWRLGNLLVEEARRRSASVAIDIRRPGRILFHAALAGATGDNDEWIRRKANVCFRFERSSLAVHVSLALAGLTIEEKSHVSSMEFSAHGGAFPIRVKGAGLVACATVSGLPQEEDHALVVACLRSFAATGN